eukprot:3799440-Rhodomonas_salina.1
MALLLVLAGGRVQATFSVIRVQRQSANRFFSFASRCDGAYATCTPPGPSHLPTDSLLCLFSSSEPALRKLLYAHVLRRLLPYTTRNSYDLCPGNGIPVYNYSVKRWVVNQDC